MNKTEALAYLDQFYENQYDYNYDNYSALGNWLRATFGWFQNPKVVALSSYLKSLPADATVDPDQLRALAIPPESASATESDGLLRANTASSSSLDQLFAFIEQLLGLIRREEFVRMDHQADLEKFPATGSTPSSTTEVTLGDLHGNAMKLIYFLLREGVIEGLNAEDYNQLLDLYYTPLDSSLRSAQIDAHMQQFNALIDKIKLPDNPAQRAKLVRLIGDILADRGENDYYTLRILKKLKDIGLNVEIQASNHDFSFLTDYSHPTSEGEKARFTARFGPGQASSTQNLTILLNRAYSVPGLRARLRAEVAEALPAYRAAVKLVGYSLSPDRTHISIYTHAPVGLETLRELATELEVEFNAASVEELARSIDRINEAAKIGSSSREQIARLFAKAPFERLIWARYLDDPRDGMRHVTTNEGVTAITLDRPASLGTDTVAYIHGHTPGETGLEHIFNLDSDFGKRDLHFGERELRGLYLSYRREAAALSAAAEERHDDGAEDDSLGTDDGPHAALPPAIAAVSLSPVLGETSPTEGIASPATVSDEDLTVASGKAVIPPVAYPHAAREVGKVPHDAIDLARASGHAYLRRADEKKAAAADEEAEARSSEDLRGF